MITTSCCFTATGTRIKGRDPVDTGGPTSSSGRKEIDKDAPAYAQDHTADIKKIDEQGMNTNDDTTMGDGSGATHPEVVSDASMKESSLSEGLPTQASLSSSEEDTADSDNGDDGDSPMEEEGKNGE